MLHPPSYSSDNTSDATRGECPLPRFTSTLRIQEVQRRIEDASGRIRRFTETGLIANGTGSAKVLGSVNNIIRHLMDSDGVTEVLQSITIIIDTVIVTAMAANMNIDRLPSNQLSQIKNGSARQDFLKAHLDDIYTEFDKQLNDLIRDDEHPLDLKEKTDEARVNFQRGFVAAFHHSATNYPHPSDAKAEDNILAEELGLVYMEVLTSAFPPDFLLVESNKKTVQSVLATVALFQGHVCVDTAAAILGMNHRDLNAVLGQIASIVVVPRSSADFIRPLHHSLGHFLTTVARRKVPDLSVDSRTHHGQIALACLQTIITHPSCHRNIMELDDPLVPKSSIPEFWKERDEKMPPHIKYACLHWLTRLGMAARSSSLDEVLSQFVTKKLLVWTEAMSLHDELDVAVKALTKARDWCQVNDDLTSADILYDLYRFVLRYFDLINGCPEQIYCSALPLMPLCRLYQLYAEEAALTLLTPPLQDWGPCLRTFESLDGPIACVRSSPDGRFIASSSWDHTVRTWDAESGILLSTMHGHQDWVVSLDISPGGKHIASVSRDGFLRLWDVASGEAVLNKRVCWEGIPIEAPIQVAFSPDGTTFATSAIARIQRSMTWTESPAIGQPEEETTVGRALIQLWDVQSGNDVRSAFIGEAQYPFASFAYSPSGRLIATASADGLIRLWNPATLALLKTFSGHTDDATAVAFFHRSEKLVSCSVDTSLRIWDIRDGKLLKVLDGHWDRVVDVAISPQDDYIASASCDFSFRLWDAQSGTPLAVLIPDAYRERCFTVAFTCDGSKLVTGGYDCTVRTWDFKNVKPGLELDNSFLQVSCVAFTEDGSHLFAAYNDREFAISKVMKHTLIRPTPHVCCANAVTSHSNNDELRATRIGQMEAYRTARWTRGVVRCAAFSSDCRILATGCSTHIGLWSLEDLNLVMEIEHNLKWRRMHTTLLLQFSRDGSQIYAKSSEGTSCAVWSCTTGEREDDLVEGDWRSVAERKPRFYEDEGWVIDRSSGRKLCWLPYSRRADGIDFGSVHACYQNYYAAGSGYGLVTILDLTPVL